MILATSSTSPLQALKSAKYVHMHDTIDKNVVHVL